MKISVFISNPASEALNFSEKKKELLEMAVEKSCKSEPEIGVVFSAGIDSTIMAMLASKFSRVTAYSCGVVRHEQINSGNVSRQMPAVSPDLEYVDKCRNLNFEIKTIELDPEKIEMSLAKIIHVINDTNPVKVSVEIPFYFASKKAKEDGLDVMLCGQGADEMFGGYNKYLSPLPDYPVVCEMMKKDVENIYTEQINKDMAVCKANGIELRAPYMDEEFKNYVLGISTELKLHEVKNSEEFGCVDVVDDRRFIRKYILRILGKEVGVPDPVLNRRKKAAQYGSGTWKVLDRIARKEGFKEKARKAGRTDYVRFFLESYAEEMKND